MSYSEFLNRKKINTPKVVATNMSLGDASSFTWRRKLAASSIYRPTDHVITNVSDPSVTPNLYSKKSLVTKGNGYGGKVPDASTYTLNQSARSLGNDTFSNTKLIIGGGSGNKCLAAPPASQVVSQLGNSDNRTRGLNLGYIASCPSGKFTPGTSLTTPEYRPLTKSYFVDTIPVIQTNKIGVQNPSTFSGVINTQAGSQNPIICRTTSTTGNWTPKAEVRPNLYSLGPIKTDFLTGILGPQVSTNGSSGRAPKVGAALANEKYVEKHHGNPNVRAWGPRNTLLRRAPQPAAPAQLKINSAMH
jgi:hypothetical protein